MSLSGSLGLARRGGRGNCVLPPWDAGPMSRPAARTAAGLFFVFSAACVSPETSPKPLIRWGCFSALGLVSKWAPTSFRVWQLCVPGERSPLGCVGFRSTRHPGRRNPDLWSADGRSGGQVMSHRLDGFLAFHSSAESPVARPQVRVASCQSDSAAMRSALATRFLLLRDFCLTHLPSGDVPPRRQLQPGAERTFVREMRSSPVLTRTESLALSGYRSPSISRQIYSKDAAQLRFAS